MKELFTEGDVRFLYAADFDVRFLAPVGAFVLWKLENEWDDYDELYHAVRFFEGVRGRDDVTVDSHLMMKGERVVGCMFFIKGQVASLENRYAISQPESAMLLKYFHIRGDHRGAGKRWLKEIVSPFYRKAGMHIIYVSSSHPKSFGLYESLGPCIAAYESSSDNALFIRSGKSFRIDL